MPCAPAEESFDLESLERDRAWRGAVDEFVTGMDSCNTKQMLDLDVTERLKLIGVELGVDKLVVEAALNRIEKIRAEVHG